MEFLDAKHLYEALMYVCMYVCMYVFLSPFFEDFSFPMHNEQIEAKGSQEEPGVVNEN